MHDRPHVLILTAPTGGGHLSLAEALRDQLGMDFAVTILHMLPSFFGYHYRFVGRHALGTWSIMFHLSNTPARALSLHRLIYPFISTRLAQALDQIRPDLVITTHSLLSFAVERVLEKHSPDTPFVMLFSDPYSIHATWFSVRDAAAAFAPTREAYKQALAPGFDPDRLHLVGWPVRGQFYRQGGTSVVETLTCLNLDPGRFTIFLQGGGDGGTNFWRNAEHLLATNQGVQVILATGTNRALLKRFKAVKNLYALPFTKEIAPYMAAADVVMGKAGPNAFFEAVILGKPFIATTNYPGQEEGNLEFIEQYGLGWVALKLVQQSELITLIARNSTQANTVRGKIKEYRQWNDTANTFILPLIRSLVARNRQLQT